MPSRRLQGCLAARDLGRQFGPLQRGDHRVGQVLGVRFGESSGDQLLGDHGPPAGERLGRRPLDAGGTGRRADDGGGDRAAVEPVGVAQALGEGGGERDEGLRGVQTPPSGIGSPEFDTFYSGPRDLFEQYEDVLKVMTGTDYRGEDPGLAALCYQLQMDLLWTTLTAWLHTLALADANGISASEIGPYAAQTLGGMGQFLDFYTPRIEAGRHSGDVERISMAVASMEHVVHTARDAGVDPALPAAVLEAFRRAAAEGYGEDSLTRLFEVFGRDVAA